MEDCMINPPDDFDEERERPYPCPGGCGAMYVEDCECDHTPEMPEDFPCSEETEAAATVPQAA